MTRNSDDDDATGQILPYVLYFEEGRGAFLLNLLPYADELRRIVDDERESVTAAPRQRRHWGRPRLFDRVSAVVSVTVLAAASLAVLPAEGADRPAKVFQAVDIELGGDGSLLKVQSTDVRAVDGKTSSRKVRLDPSKVAHELPVRVLTSYVHDGRTGTNLADLEGVKGRVQVTITVQNATVHPEKLSYDVEGVRQERFALIGMPMTVTASAVLPKDSLAKVVLPSPDAQGAVTNGILGRTRSGDTTVQWAAPLAPPRLAASASFTLVEDATSFRLPRFDLSVQPGLASDTSVDRLVREAFSKDGNGKLTLTNNAMLLVVRVNAVLERAAQTLEKIRTALADDASTLGTQLIGQLATSSSQLTAAAGDLSASLAALDTSLGETLQQSRDDNVAALHDTISALSDYIGRPDATPITPLPIAPGCVLDFAGGDKATTLYGQLRKVSQHLLTLRSATQGCAATVTAALGEVLGDPADCPAGATSLSCLLTGTRSRLLAVANYVATAGGALLAQLDPTAIDDVRAALGTVTQKVVNLQAAAGKLGNGNGGNDVDSLQGQLDAIAAALDAVIADVEGAGLAVSLDTLHDMAVQHRDRIGGSGGSASSISGQVAAAAAAACATPSAFPTADPDTTAYVATLRSLLVGTSCGAASPLPAPSGYTAPVADRLELEYAAWSRVADLTDLAASSPAGAAKEAKDLAVALRGLRDDLGAISLLATGGGTGGGVKKKLDDLLVAIAALYTAPAEAGSCPPGDPAALPPLNALSVAFAGLDCNQRGMAANLAALLVSATPTYVQAANDAASAAAAANQARLDAAGALGALLGALDSSLATTAQETLDDGTAVVGDQQRQLADQETKFTTNLDLATREAIAEMGASIGESNQLLTESTQLLQHGLEQVQLDLGTGGSSPRGLLGVVNSSASRTAASAQDVGNAIARTSAYRGVRAADLDDVLLQQQQLTRAFELQADYPPFALTLPPGSTSSTVFSFHLQGD